LPQYTTSPISSGSMSSGGASTSSSNRARTEPPRSLESKVIARCYCRRHDPAEAAPRFSTNGCTIESAPLPARHAARPSASPLPIVQIHSPVAIKDDGFRMQFDVIVIGAGAAGMMCAATAGARGRRVLLIDHAAKLAEKIRISGGGRCNFTNRDLKPDNFLSDNPHFCRSALSRYTPQHFIALVDSHGIAHHEKTLGQLFCDDSSQQIIDMLKAECDGAGVTWQRPSAVLGVAQHDAGGFSVNTDRGRAQRSVAGHCHRRIDRTQDRCHAFRVPRRRTVRPESRAAAASAGATGAGSGLAGALRRTVGCILRFDRILRRPDVSRTDPADASRPLRPGDPSGIELLAAGRRTRARRHRSAARLCTMSKDWLQAARSGRQTLAALLSEHLPKRFAQQWIDVEGAGKWNAALVELPRAALTDIAQRLKCWPIQPSGTLGYNKAEVTLGGVDTRELDQRTMAARRRTGAVLRRRGGGCDRLARRLQLPVGLVIRLVRRSGGVRER
jgi:hypothetical protein